MFYKCKHFRIEELVDKLTFDRFGEKSWMFFNQSALKSLDSIREYFGVQVIVNNWLWGGELQYRGLRPKYVQVGSEYSQHRLGNAFDCTLEGVTADKVREEILKNKDKEGFELITCVENKVSWLHFDCRNIENRILIVNPY